MPRTRDEVRAFIDHMPPEMRKEVSATWLAMLESLGARSIRGSTASRSSTRTAARPWVRAASRVRRTRRAWSRSRTPSIPSTRARATRPKPRPRWSATRSAVMRCDWCARTRCRCRMRRRACSPKCGFQRVGEAIDPDDGLVWRWEYRIVNVRESGARNTASRVSCGAVALAFATAAHAAPMADLDAWDAAQQMGIGINIGNTLDNTTTWETGWGNPPHHQGVRREPGGAGIQDGPAAGGLGHLRERRPHRRRQARARRRGRRLDHRRRHVLRRQHPLGRRLD